MEFHAPQQNPADSRRSSDQQADSQQKKDGVPDLAVGEIRNVHTNKDKLRRKTCRQTADNDTACRQGFREHQRLSFLKQCSVRTLSRMEKEASSRMPASAKDSRHRSSV